MKKVNVTVTMFNSGEDKILEIIYGKTIQNILEELNYHVDQYGLYNLHDKRLPNNLPIRGDLLLTLKENDS
jgi:hypothetical protein